MSNCQTGLSPRSCDRARWDKLSLKPVRCASNAPGQARRAVSVGFPFERCPAPGARVPQRGGPALPVTSTHPGSTHSRCRRPSPTLPLGLRSDSTESSRQPQRTTLSPAGANKAGALPTRPGRRPRGHRPPRRCGPPGRKFHLRCRSLLGRRHRRKQRRSRRCGRQGPRRRCPRRCARQGPRHPRNRWVCARQGPPPAIPVIGGFDETDVAMETVRVGFGNAADGDHVVVGADLYCSFPVGLCTDTAAHVALVLGPRAAAAATRAAVAAAAAAAMWQGSRA